MILKRKFKMLIREDKMILESLKGDNKLNIESQELRQRKNKWTQIYKKRKYSLRWQTSWRGLINNHEQRNWFFAEFVNSGFPKDTKWK